MADTAALGPAVTQAAPTKAARRSVNLISVVMVAVSLALPAVQFTQDAGTGHGHILTYNGFEMAFYATLFGWWLHGNFAFLANPLLLCGWIFIAQQRFRRATVFLGIAAALGLEVFQLRGMEWNEEEGVNSICHMTHPVLGWYLWFAAILLPLAAALFWRSSEPPTPAKVIAAPPTAV